MNRTRKLTLVVSVVALAAGMGHLMQGAEAARPDAARVAPPDPVPLAPVAAAPTTRPAAAQTAAELPAVTGASLAAAPRPAPVAPAPPVPALTLADAGTAEPAPVPSAERLAVADPRPDAAADTLPPRAAPQPVQAAAPACADTIGVAALPGAMVQVTLDAPCHPDARVVLRHAGLAVTGQTSAAGTLAVDLPAFASPAAITVQFDDGSRLSAETGVPDLSLYDRLAVQWFGDDAFALQAYVGGAAFGDPGHISAAAPRRAGSAGGFLSVLGDGTTERPLQAQVFTWPVGLTAAADAVRLDIEAPVNAATCGREMLGETIEHLGGTLRQRDITMPMPDCDGTEGFLVLPNLAADLKLAAE